MENELKESINTRWGILDEFKLYKFNRDRKRGIELEQLRGHFSENRDSFSKKCQEEFGRKVAQLLPPTTSVKFIPQFTQTELTENFNGSTINI